ncbi:hypothetical protein [Paraburkholderia caribensis]|uniref:hypothetical protein n=1 Tax=Paraburkholderia caribensis TaxID=75105 RepID=UPI001CB66CB1|nr:hypothetical protein [Paraburkholderia caribensis]CAG9255909.1 hypothetical protein PCAR4_40168 [Paraburkholderia caribensis]
MTDLPNPLTPADAEKLREAIALLMTLGNRQASAVMAARLTIYLAQRAPVER